MNLEIPSNWIWLSKFTDSRKFYSLYLVFQLLHFLSKIPYDSFKLSNFFLILIFDISSNRILNFSCLLSILQSVHCLFIVKIWRSNTSNHDRFCITTKWVFKKSCEFWISIGNKLLSIFVISFFCKCFNAWG